MIKKKKKKRQETGIRNTGDIRNERKEGGGGGVTR